MLDRRLIIIGGKGGVGRTTVAAALATVLARAGRRTLLAHVRTRQRVGQMLGCRELDETIREVEPNLYAVNMNPAAALEEIGLKVLRFRAVYRAVMHNRLVKYFLRAIPALDEYSMLGKAWYHTTEQRDGQDTYDTVILDGPATGHLVTMLRIPHVIMDVVPEGPLTRDAREVRDLIVDPARCGMWIVALAEEMAVSEAVDLYLAAREDVRVRPEWLVVNALYPESPADAMDLGEDLERLSAAVAGRPDARSLEPLIGAARTIRSRRALNERHLGALRSRVPLPTIEIPHLFAGEVDRTQLDRVARRIEQALAAGDSSGHDSLTADERP